MNIHKSFLSRRGFTAAFVTAVVPLLLLSSLGCAFMLGRHRNVCVSASSAPRSGVYPQMWYSAAIGYEGLLRNLIVPIFPTFESSWITQVHCYNKRAQSLKITQKCHISSASTTNVVYLTEKHFDTWVMTRHGSEPRSAERCRAAPTPIHNKTKLARCEKPSLRYYYIWWERCSSSGNVSSDRTQFGWKARATVSLTVAESEATFAKFMGTKLGLWRERRRAMSKMKMEDKCRIH